MGRCFRGILGYQIDSLVHNSVLPTGTNFLPFVYFGLLRNLLFHAGNTMLKILAGQPMEA